MTHLTYRISLAVADHTELFSHAVAHHDFAAAAQAIVATLLHWHTHHSH
jgi:hypothetical protein